jgi:hypothetical protein
MTRLCASGEFKKTEISDWYCHGLRLMLDRSGLIINREVEVRNATGRGVGQRQDIRVEVKEPDTGDHFVTVIEVKGIWNSGVKTNLVTQLVGDYLIGGGLSHGVYLVVTFDPSQISVVSKATASKSNLKKLAATLANQARSVDKALTVIPVIHSGDMPA